MDRKRIFRVMLACLMILAGIFLLSLFYRCPFSAVTGIPCPGCGMTRALFALLQLDFAGAWKWNPMIYPLSGCAVYAVVCCLAGRFDLARSTRFWSTVGVLMLIVWLVRFPGFVEEQSWLTIREGSLGAGLISWIGR